MRKRTVGPMAYGSRPTDVFHLMGIGKVGQWWRGSEKCQELFKFETGHRSRFGPSCLSSVVHHVASDEWFVEFPRRDARHVIEVDQLFPGIQNAK